MDQYLYQQIFYYIAKEYAYTFPHFPFITSKFMIYKKYFIGEEQILFTMYVGLLLAAP